MAAVISENAGEWIRSMHTDKQALAAVSLTSLCMTSWWRWDLWRQMNFSLRDNKVVDGIENRTNGVEKLHLSFVSLPKWRGVCFSKWRDGTLDEGRRFAHRCLESVTTHYSHSHQTSIRSNLAHQCTWNTCIQNQRLQEVPVYYKKLRVDLLTFLREHQKSFLTFLFF